MTKIRKVIAGFIGSVLIGSTSTAMNQSSEKGKVESKIHSIMKALHSKKVRNEQSKRIFEYLEENHKLNSIDLNKTNPNPESTEMNSGNWDNWNNWSNWDTWNNWSNWDTWNNWSNWDTWNNWSNYQ